MRHGILVLSLIKAYKYTVFYPMTFYPIIFIFCFKSKFVMFCFTLYSSWLVWFMAYKFFNKDF